MAFQKTPFFAEITHLNIQIARDWGFLTTKFTLMAKRNIEHQTIEFKESWRDDHLKTICALANTKDGKLHIGIDDSGSPKGVKEARKLLEDIPNKIKGMLGVIPSVEIKKVKGKDVLVIEIKPYESPISYGGETDFSGANPKNTPPR
jgi:predicted HTH transcriptional regulator